MTETFASRLITASKSGHSVGDRVPTGERGRVALRAGLVAWTSFLILAAQGCSMIGSPSAPKLDADYVWTEPGLTDPVVNIAHRSNSPEFTHLLQLAALDQVADRAPTQAKAEEELFCLAQNIYFEARSEPRDGKIAVSNVVMNRVADARFPDTVCKVIRQGGARVKNRCQFSWWCDGRSDKPRNKKLWEISQDLAEDVYWGRSEDLTDGALWYHAVYVSPYWGRVYKRGPRYGLHVFYHDNKKIVVASRQ